MYTIGIKRKVFGYKKYKVTSHRTDISLKVGDDKVMIDPRLFLTLTDNSYVIISNITKKQWKIFPDFEAENLRKKQQWQEAQMLKSSMETQAV